MDFVVPPALIALLFAPLAGRIIGNAVNCIINYNNRPPIGTLTYKYVAGRNCDACDTDTVWSESEEIIHKATYYPILGQKDTRCSFERRYICALCGEKVERYPAPSVTTLAPLPTIKEETLEEYLRRGAIVETDGIKFIDRMDYTFLPEAIDRLITGMPLHLSVDKDPDVEAALLDYMKKTLMPPLFEHGPPINLMAHAFLCSCVDCGMARAEKRNRKQQ